jgi:hypothetical protein
MLQIIFNAIVLVALTLVISGCRQRPAASASVVEVQPQANTMIEPARVGSSMAYDERHHVMVLFGGGGFSDTWIWDGQNWRQQHPQNEPLPRSEASMAYDAARDQMLLFGGIGKDGNALADTWAWDGTNWQMLNPATTPPARSQANLAYDVAHQRLILFGGLLPTEGKFESVTNDTWTWDGANWQALASAEAPEARSQASMTYDTAHQRLVLFGGFDGNGMINDTWTWDGASWQRQQSTPLPPARIAARMVYDGRQTILFSGSAETGDFNDIWFWNGRAWRRGLPSPSPSGAYVLAAYDSAQHLVLAYVVHVRQKYITRGETWLWNGDVWVQA